MRWIDLRDRYGVPLLVFVAEWVVFSALSSNFTSVSTAYAILNGLPLVGLIAIGLSVTVIAGELDFSVASNAVVAGVIAVEVSPAGLLPALLVPMLCGMTYGLLQGYVIAKLQISSLVFSLALMIFLGGVAYVITNNSTVLMTNLNVSNPLLERWGIFSIGSLVGLAVLVVVGLVLAFTKYGREIYAVGGGKSEAYAAGVPLLRPVCLSFCISGGTASLAGALTAIRGGSASGTGFSTTLLLSATAAVLIGGIGLRGGRGTMLNVALGVAIVTALSVGLAALYAQFYVTQLATGLLLFLVVILQTVMDSVSARTRLRRRQSVRHRRRTALSAGT